MESWVGHQRECVYPFDNESGPKLEFCVEHWEAGTTLQYMVKCMVCVYACVRVGESMCKDAKCLLWHVGVGARALRKVVR